MTEFKLSFCRGVLKMKQAMKTWQFVSSTWKVFAWRCELRVPEVDFRLWSTKYSALQQNTAQYCCEVQSSLTSVGIAFISPMRIVP